MTQNDFLSNRNQQNLPFTLKNTRSSLKNQEKLNFFSVNHEMRESNLFSFNHTKKRKRKKMKFLCFSFIIFPFFSTLISYCFHANIMEMCMKVWKTILLSFVEPFVIYFETFTRFSFCSFFLLLDYVISLKWKIMQGRNLSEIKKNRWYFFETINKTTKLL